MSFGRNLICASLFSMCCLWAQSDANKGSIAGTVFDPNQAVIPNVKVSVSNTATGLQREVTTNDSGQYRIGALDPGSYDVKADAPGFAKAAAQGVRVTVGASVSLDIKVALQTTVETVNVSATLVGVGETVSSQTLNLQAIQNLPINGRRFQDFAALTPTVQYSSDTRGQLSFSGQRGINSNVMVDGTDYNEPFFGGIRGGERSIFAFTVPQSAIQEFQAVAAGYSAEYGRSSGGILNAITRSGANGFHGDAFYQIRHKELGLSNPYKQQSLETQQQFGGGIGGPIKRDRAFFFGAVEQQFSKYPRRVRFATLDSVASNVTPEISAAYSFLRSLEVPYKQTNDATALLGRLDYQFANGSRLTGRYQFSNNIAENGVSVGNILIPELNNSLSNNGTEKDRTYIVAGQYTSVLGPNMLNDFRSQYSREIRPRINNANTPTIGFGSIGTLGSVRFLPTTLTDYRLQFADSFSIQRGNHAIKFGVDFSLLDVFQTFGFNQFGYYNIIGSNVTALLRTMSANGTRGLNRFDDPSVQYSRQIGNLQLGAKSKQLAFFAQDAWRVTRNFTLNYGLRWDGQFNPQPATNNDFLVQNVRDFTFPLGRVDPTVIKSQVNQVAPRLGFAWNLGGSNKSVLRAQTGIYYAQTPTLLYAGPLNNFRLPAGDLSLTIGPSPTIYQLFKGIGVDLNTASLDKLPIISNEQFLQLAGPGRNPFLSAAPTTTSGNNYRNPRAYQVTASYEREVVRGLVLDYSFNHVNTVHLERNIDFNVPLPRVRPGDASQRPFFGLRSGTRRPNPNLNAVTVRDSGARSNFSGNTFRVRYTSKKLQLASSYTLAYNKSDDDNERSTGGTTFQNPFDLRREYNWSTLDARHQFNGYAVYFAPMGIEIGASFRARSAYPIDPSTGGDTAELQAGNVGNRPLQAPGVSFLRNSFRNYNYKTMDLRFLKNFTIHERWKVQFSCEMFNMFNFDNINIKTAASDPGQIYGLGLQTNGQPAPIDPRFRRLISPAGGYDSTTSFQQGVPFQAQLGLRLIF